MAKLGLDEWQAEGLRVSAFMAEPNDPGQLGLWQAVGGDMPEVSQFHPREQRGQEGGPFLGGWLTVEVTAGRIDWRLRADNREPPVELPTIGQYGTAVQDFREPMRKWLEGGLKLSRLAFGAVLLMPTESVVAAYQTLDGLLPSVKIDPENTRDLVYRINRRRPSRGPMQGLQINRLCTWSAGQLRSAMIELTEGAELRQIGKPQDICKLELDINTASEFGELDTDALPTLFDELVELGNEIASEGDTP